LPASFDERGWMAILDTIGWRATGLRNRIVDRFRERRLGIDTGGHVEVNRPDANRYSTFAYSSILKILGNMHLRPDDVFIDIGCGKGRVVCCAATLSLRKVMGIDIDEGLCETARLNAARARGRASPIEIIHSGAQDFDYRDCTAFFLFNSFGAATLKMVLDSIEQSLRGNPRSIRFAYVNPFFDELLGKVEGFERYDRWKRRAWSGLKFDVSFWKRDCSVC
jgi:SAM-dependent methyltransferase